MGREVRRVPPNWKHPKIERHGRLDDQPMYDEAFDAVFARWLEDFDRIRAGNLTDLERECYPRGLADWLKDEGVPPDPDYYRPWRDEEATWFQLWQTVSKGSPVSPPFATEDELIAYLAENGDFWDQSRAAEGRAGFRRGQKTGWGMERARAFVKAGCAPSMILAGGAFIESKDIPAALATKS